MDTVLSELIPAVRAELERRREMGRRATARPWRVYAYPDEGKHEIRAGDALPSSPDENCPTEEHDFPGLHATVNLIEWEHSIYPDDCEYGQAESTAQLITTAANSWDASLDAIEALVEMLEQYGDQHSASVDRAIERLRAWLEAG